MAVALSQIITGQYIPNTTTTLYTVNSGETVLVNHATIFNADNASSQTLTLYVVPTGDSPGDENALVKNLSIASERTDILEELNGHILNAGTTIQAIASTASKLSIQVSGTVRT